MDACARKMGHQMGYRFRVKGLGVRLKDGVSDGVSDGCVRLSAIHADLP